MSRSFIAFTHNYSKLSFNQFHTVRWLDYKVELGKVYDIHVVANNIFHRKYVNRNMRVIRLEIKKLSELSNQFILDDADCNPEEFMKLMFGWYGKKKDWKGVDSEVQVIYLKEV